VNAFLSKDLLGIAYDKASALSVETTGESLTNFFTSVLHTKDKKKSMLCLPKTSRYQQFVFERALLMESDQPVSEGRHLFALSRLASHTPYFSPVPVVSGAGDPGAAVPRSSVGYHSMTQAQARQALLIPGTASVAALSSLMSLQDAVLKDASPLPTRYSKFVPAGLSCGLATWQACQDQVDDDDAEFDGGNVGDDDAMGCDQSAMDGSTLLLSPFTPQYLAGYVSQVKHTTPHRSQRQPRTSSTTDGRRTGGSSVATPNAGRVDSSPFLSPHDSAPLSLGALTGGRLPAPAVFQEPPKTLLRRFGPQTGLRASGLNASAGPSSIGRLDAPPQFFKPPSTPGLVSPALIRQQVHPPPLPVVGDESAAVVPRHQDQEFRQPPRSRLTFGLRPMVPK
jgi:hypothetical protein